jgi:hypothetical protein
MTPEEKQRVKAQMKATSNEKKAEKYRFKAAKVAARDARLAADETQSV